LRKLSHLVLLLTLISTTFFFSSHIETVYAGAKLALVVGVGDYQDPDISDLNGPPEDAREFDTYLRGRGWYTRVLIDAQATKANILDGLNNLVNTPSYDYVLFYFSGHGDRSADVDPIDEIDGQDGYICPYDSVEADNSMDISDDFFTTWVRDVQSNHLAIILDSCYSGEFVRIITAHDFGGTPLDARNNALVASACDEAEEAYETQWPDGWNSDYTYFTEYWMN